MTEHEKDFKKNKPTTREIWSEDQKKKKDTRPSIEVQREG